MKIAIIIYASVSLMFGGLAAAFEVWDRPSELTGADGSKFPAPRHSALGIGLFVTVCWPVLLIGAIL